MLGHASFGGLAKVVPQVPAIGHLAGLRGAERGAFGVERSPVAADDLDLRVPGEPGGDGLWLPVGQQVKRAPAEWMPWNYRQRLTPAVSGIDSG